MKINIVLAVPLAFASACSSSVDVCPAVVKPAVVVEVRDASTGLPIAEGASGAVREGSYTDSLKPYSGISANQSTLLSLQAALGRPGLYTLTVEKPGYASFTATGVQATAGACGVQTATVKANLIKAGP
jgi:hypothetical protein